MVIVVCKIVKRSVVCAVLLLLLSPIEVAFAEPRPGTKIREYLGNFEVEITATVNEGGCRNDFSLTRQEVEAFFSNACVIAFSHLNSYLRRGCWVEGVLNSELRGKLKFQVVEGGTGSLEPQMGDYINLVCDEPCRAIFETVGPEVTEESSKPLRISNDEPARCLALEKSVKGGKYVEPKKPIQRPADLFGGNVAIRSLKIVSQDSHASCGTFKPGAREVRKYLQDARILELVDDHPPTRPCWIEGSVQTPNGIFHFKILKGGVAEVWKEGVSWNEFVCGPSCSAFAWN